MKIYLSLRDIPSHLNKIIQSIIIQGFDKLMASFITLV